jgi:threonine dehydrogenase-like Zn-dependent dehydrogenase
MSDEGRRLPRHRRYPARGPEPKIQDPTDAIVRLTASAICHRKYIPRLVELTRTGVVDPFALVTQVEDVTDAVSAFEEFDRRRPGWLKVVLDPAPATA